MHQISRSELVDALHAAGLQRGDLVHVQSDLRAIGPTEASRSREGTLEFYLAGFREVIGDTGTLTVLTATMSCGRYLTPFVLEETPSEVGVFSDFIRQQPGAVRSCHPILSITGIGPHAQEICGGPHFDAFGYDSTWARLHRAGGKMVTLGMGIGGGGTTFFHYLETLHGVPYKYTKLLSIPVFARGAEVSGPFTISVRYHDFNIKNTPTRLKQHLVDVGRAKCPAVGGSFVYCSPCADVIEEGIGRLREDRWFLLEAAPRFRLGEIPMDGGSGAMRLRYDKAEGTAR